ncbi:Purine nucleoside phosphorylase 1 [Pirellula sp. SH-Sr6A]|nr:Purine nucleoside phosphorylase 1 [Pirellula sp. SH-Sr6A]
MLATSRALAQPNLVNIAEKYVKLPPLRQPQNPVKPKGSRILHPTQSDCQSLPHPDLNDALQEIRATVGDFSPFACLILGSGMGALANEIQSSKVVPYREIPGFPLSHVAGHAGKCVFGYLGGVSVFALAGRAHLYEGWEPQHSCFPLRCAAAMGATSLIVSNASGGIHPRFRSGQVVAIDDHIDWMQRSPFCSRHHRETTRPLGLHDRHDALYDARWLDLATQEALQLGFSLHRGTYLATLGPTYETRAEYRMFQKWGADMVGMSTVPEIVLAKHLQMRSLAFSIVTNVAKPDSPTKTDHAEVLDWSQQAQQQLVPLIEKLLPRMQQSPL